MKNAGFTSREVRTALAAENSRAYLKDVHEYKGVDGRVYQTDRPMPDHEAHMTKKQIAIAKQNERMSMTELRRMEIFLETGSRKPFRSCDLKQADKDRIFAEYPVKMDAVSKRYEGDLKAVWAVLAAKFPERAARYPKGYKQAQYALRYGEAPVTIIQEGKHDKD